MPPRRPFGQEDAHHDGLRSSSSRGESGRHGTLGTNKRSPKLEVSFLLNNQSHSAAGTSNGSGEHQRGRLGSQSTASPKSRGERRSTGGSSSGQRRYHCDFCPATFAQSHDLLKHKRTVHEKLRPFTCDICNKSFGEKGNLSKHKKSVHLNERPFPCEFCSSSFAFKDGLQRHRSLVHYDMRPFVCKMCGADFKQISQLRKHSCPRVGPSSSRGHS